MRYLISLVLVLTCAKCAIGKFYFQNMVNLNSTDDEIVNAIQNLTSIHRQLNKYHGAPYGTFVIELVAMIEKNIARKLGYHVLVANMDQAYEKELFAPKPISLALWNNREYGLIVFKCGWYKIYGEHHHENWYWGGPCYRRVQDDIVHFHASDCPGRDYRYMNRCEYQFVAY